LDLSVIIVNYNVKHFLEHCLASVAKAITTIHAEVFVVDNNSNDGSKAYFERRFTNFQFIYNTENVGFAKGNNVAVKKAIGKYILFLNPDTIVAEDTFTKCISFLEQNKDAGALGIKMIDGAGTFLKESKRSFPSPITSFYKLSGFARLFPKSPKFAKYHLGNLDSNTTNAVDVLAGAFIMVQKNILDKIGSFDESFFMYGEDVDLSYRIQQAGYKNYYFADTTIIHFKGESTKRGSLNYVRMFYKAMSQFVTKHYGQSKASTFNLFIQLAIFIRGSLAAIKRFILFIGLPLIDAGVILLSIWGAKLFWYAKIKPDVRYVREIVVGAAIIYTIVYVVSSYLSGLYDKPYKQKNVNRSALISTLLLIALYGLLPEHYRFSRGIILLSAAVIFVTLSLLRFLLVKMNVLDRVAESDEEKQTVVVSKKEDYAAIKSIYEKAKLSNRLLGYVNTDDSKGLTAFTNLKSFEQSIPFTNILYSANSLTYKEIITLVETNQKHKVKFYAEAAHSIIGSDSKNTIGETITQHGNFNIANASAIRGKRLIDVFFSILFLLFAPILFWVVKKEIGYFQNFWQVFIGRKTLVGYNTTNDLPIIKEGLFSNNGSFYSVRSTLSNELLYELDYRYAKSYKCRQDVIIFWRKIFGK
jgi:GT2 family glycosyltransferase